MSTRTSKNNIKWWEILPSSDKEIKVLKNSFNFWLRPRKKNSIRNKYRVIFTYRRRCMLRDRTIFVQNQLLCLQARLSDWPTYLYHYICLFLSAFFGKYKLFETLSLDHSQSILRPSIMWPKKEPTMFCSANFPRLPRNLNNFRLSRVEERMNFKKQNIPKKIKLP